jgi:hypothetical protein
MKTKSIFKKNLQSNTTDSNKLISSLDKLNKDITISSNNPLVNSFRKKNLSKFEKLVTQQKIQSKSF